MNTPIEHNGKLYKWLCECGTPTNRGKECSGCYGRRNNWYKKLSKQDKQKLFNKIYDKQKSDPEQRNRYSRKWSISVGRIITPELKILRQSVKFLEKTVAEARERQGTGGTV